MLHQPVGSGYYALQFALDPGSCSRGSERPFSCASFCRGLHNPFVKHSFSMRLNMTGVNMCGLQMVSNLRSLGLKSSKFSRLAGAAPRAGAAKRLKAGAAGILLLSRVSFANIGCKCCAFFGASLPERPKGVSLMHPDGQMASTLRSRSVLLSCFAD